PRRRRSSRFDCPRTHSPATLHQGSGLELRGAVSRSIGFVDSPY
ncbi:dihydrouridine synthase (dus) protein, partial [Toxoplasma gondii CAST]